MVSLGTRIRELRQERGLTQEQLGEKLLMRKSTISDYENDVIDIKISVLREIAAALHVYPDYFLKGDDLNPKIRDAVFAACLILTACFCLLIRNMMKRIRIEERENGEIPPPQEGNISKD